MDNQYPPQVTPLPPTGITQFAQQPRIQHLMQQMREARGGNPPQDWWRGQMPRPMQQQSIAPVGTAIDPTGAALAQNANALSVAPRTVASQTGGTAGAPGAAPVVPMQYLQSLGVSPSMMNRMNYFGNVPGVQVPFLPTNPY